ncbi:MAG: methylmalonyl Co-A mutase-associated GTPase MeaB [Acidobacteriota bacterium]
MSPDLVDRLLEGDARALARCITRVESGGPGVAGLLRRVYPHTGQAYVVGVTGAPGAGKSSLVDGLVSAYRTQGERVGVIAVDPSSAFSGGAILGDRIRMSRHDCDPGVFIRSMANRGHPGGLAEATHDAVDLLDAAGYSHILLETVGVGQDEVEVVEGADTVCVTLVPGMGDDIQSMKAGIMEIAHVFIINKCDQKGAERLEAEIDQTLSLQEWDGRWRPPVVRTVATRQEGIDSLVEQIALHRQASAASAAGGGRRRDLSRTRFLALLRERLLAAVTRRVGHDRIDAAIDAIAARKVDPYTATQEVLAAAGLAGE